ncbi:hypothetical protein L6164_029838 [Bauhinia variegata]|nr:hypothetical protein L6164_029838 [Bauhinia variegata]
MNSRSIAESTVSCKPGNKNNFLFWILVCLLPSLLGAPEVYVNSQLFKTIVGFPCSPILSHTFCRGTPIVQ